MVWLARHAVPGIERIGEQRTKGPTISNKRRGRTRFAFTVAVASCRRMPPIACVYGGKMPPLLVSDFEPQAFRLVSGREQIWIISSRRQRQLFNSPALGCHFETTLTLNRIPRHLSAVSPVPLFDLVRPVLRFASDQAPIRMPRHAGYCQG